MSGNPPSNPPEDVDLQPRNYQLQLMNVALKQNTIIFLPTGSGKTYIAVMVLKRLGEALERPFTDGGKLSIMVVNTVALVDQQSKYIRRHTHFRVGAYTGDMNVDSWDRNMWQNEFNKNQVLVMTAQILVNILHSDFLSLNKINFLIFDECHHGVSDQPMRHLMKLFQHEREPPRVLGLTASLLNRNIKKTRVQDELMALETTYHSKIATVEEMEEVVGHSTNPQEVLKTYENHMPTSVEYEAINLLKNLISVLEVLKVDSAGKSNKQHKILETNPNLAPLDPEKDCKDIINLIKDAIVHIEMLGIYGGMLAAISFTIQIECIKKHCQDLKLFNVLNAVTTTFERVEKMFQKHMEGVSNSEKIYNFSSSKVLALIQIFNLFRERSNQDLCGIIFVKRRFTAKILYHILSNAKNFDPNLSYLKPNFVVGTNYNPYCDTREGHFKSKMNRKVLNNFCTKDINLLVATNVIEEGVDIPMCTLIVKFDEPQDYRSYVQSKGRARHKNSQYYILISKDEYDTYFHVKYRQFRNVEAQLIEYLVGKTDRRKDPDEEKIQEMYEENIIAPYYVNGPNSAHVDMLTAIPLLSMYCNSLPTDVFTVYNPGWFLESKKVDEGNDTICSFKVHIELPIICPILKPIEGIFMKSKKLAKRAAALFACIQLHKVGELNSDLLPIKRSVPDPSTNFLFTHWPEEKEKFAGMNKTTRSYTKKVSNVTQGAIIPNTNLYLHLINLNPEFTQNDFNQLAIYDLLTAPLSYGIISARPFHKICDFPLYLSAGEIRVSIKENHATVILTPEQIIDLRCFHHLVFESILKVVKNFLILHNNEDEEMLLVVPIQKSTGLIDFDLVTSNKEVYEQKKELTSTERFNLTVTEESHLGKIVTPWYRTDDIQYVVTKVCNDLNATSSFATKEYKTYLEYFKDKYSCTILNPTLPLLLVKRISKRLNCLKPRGSKGKRKKEDLQEGFEEHLLPELCVKQDFPGSLWYQANLLPSIFYRLNQLLKSDELRRKVVHEANLGIVDCAEWEALHLDKSITFDNCIEEIVKEKQTCDEDEPDRSLKISELHDSLPTLINTFKNDIDTKLLELQYPWKDSEEPVDLDRTLDVTLMDIHYYELFVSKKMTQEDRELRHCLPKSSNMLALTYNEEFVHKDIQLLQDGLNTKGPELSEIYRAITALHCNEIVNFERLETLGDSFLKFVSSLYILLKYPKYDEGKSTTLKSKLVSNKNLYYLAARKNLGGILQYWEFQPQAEWCPPGYCVPKILRDRIENQEILGTSLYMYDIPEKEQMSGRLSEETIKQLQEETDEDISEEKNRTSMCHFLGSHFIPDKIVADVVEALLGAYFKSCGIQGGFKFVEWLNIIPTSENICNILQQEIPDPILDANATQEKIDFHITSWRAIEKILGYNFKNRAYLLQALTHASYTSNRITNCYQRLEFLGDAILDFLITCYIYESCGNLSPGELTDLRSALVNNVTFACFTVRCGFYKFMLSMNSKLEASVDKFVEYQENKGFAINDDVIMLLNENDLHLGESVDVPKALGDIFEALAGAVFLDSGMDLNTVWRVFYKIIWREVKTFSENVPKNAIRLLYETSGAHPIFHRPTELDSGKVMVKLDFMLNGAQKRVHGFGDNKNIAKKAAAKIALRLMN